MYNVTADQNLIDRVFPNVRLSSFSASVLRDTRNDQIDPTKGQYFSAYGQLAARALGGEVGFFKSFFRASAFKLLPNTRGIVLAGNTFFGLATGLPAAGRDGPHDRRRQRRAGPRPAPERALLRRRRYDDAGFYPWTSWA